MRRRRALQIEAEETVVAERSLHATDLLVCERRGVRPNAFRKRAVLETRKFERMRPVCVARSRDATPRRAKMATRHPAASPRRSARKQPNALRMLKDDHDKVKGLFERFHGSRSQEEKRELAQTICQIGRAHV